MPSILVTGASSGFGLAIARTFLTNAPTLVGTTAALGTGINAAAKNKYDAVSRRRHTGAGRDAGWTAACKQCKPPQIV